MFNSESQKQKFLSKLIAFTFAFNIIMPVAFASEVNASTTNGVNSDILTRKANTQANSFKSQKVNISDEELNNWINNKLQTLIDKGILNITEAEKIKIALKKKFQHIKNLRGNKPNKPVTKPNKPVTLPMPMPNNQNKPVINNPMTKPMPNNQNKPVINNPNAR